MHSGRPPVAIVLEVGQDSVQAALGGERRQQQHHVVFPGSEFQVGPNAVMVRARFPQQRDVADKGDRHGFGLFRTRHDARGKFRRPAPQASFAGNRNQQQVIIDKENLFGLFDPQADGDGLIVLVPVLVKSVAFDLRFQLGGEGDLRRAPWLVINDQEMPVEIQPVAGDLGGRIAELAAGDRHLDGEHLHLARAEREFALAWHGDSSMGGAGGVLEAHFEALFLVGIFTHKHGAALAADALADAHVFVGRLSGLFGRLGARQYRSQHAERHADATRRVILFPQAAGLADGSGIIIRGREPFGRPIEVGPAKAHVVAEVRHALFDHRLGEEVELGATDAVLVNGKLPAEFAEPSALKLRHAQG